MTTVSVLPPGSTTQPPPAAKPPPRRAVCAVPEQSAEVYTLSEHELPEHDTLTLPALEAVVKHEPIVYTSFLYAFPEQAAFLK